MALKHFSAAVDILMLQLKGKERAADITFSNSDEEEAKRTIVRALIGQVEIWMDPAYDLWCAFFNHLDMLHHVYSSTSFDPAAESNCEALLKAALKVDPDNTEALQSLASVRMSQQRPEEAKGLLDKAWSTWQSLEAGGFDAHHLAALSDLTFRRRSPVTANS